MKTKFNFKRIFSFCTGLALIFLLAVSCSKSKPEITFGFLQLVLYQGDSEPQEHFSFFIIPNDEDGLDNLDELRLYHDKEQLRWQIKSDEWISYTHDGKNWIGTRSITARDGKLPRGVFRAVLVNKGGESSERNFTFDADVRFSFPELEVSGGIYTVKSEWPVNRFVCYDRTGNYVSTVVITSFSGSVSQLRLPSNVRTVALWAEDEAYYCSAFTNVVSIY
ncbi:MAG: hypothetical protein LBU66_08730 [Treponema sp.]|jgi:hypothetical protein|nr:hypothetical protein [Treponema sp.]